MATNKRTTKKKVSAPGPKFLGRTPKNAQVQKDFPKRDPKFVGRAKNTNQKTSAK